MKKVIRSFAMAKKIFIILIFCVCIYSQCFADLFVIYKNDTKEIFTASEQDDTIVPNGYTKIKLPGGWDNYEFQHSITYYKLKDNNKFILNTDKINAEEQEKIKQAEINAEVELVKGKMADDNIAKLKAEGVIFKHETEVREKLKKGRVTTE